MNVLVDTSVWSLALRRQRRNSSILETERTAALTHLIEQGRARIIGPVKQELLSGMREEKQFVELRNRLRDFQDVSLSASDYEDAAEFGNHCRTAGIAGSPVDFLICATAARRMWEVFTMDHDFYRYAGVIPLRLHAVTAE